jgi:aminocarboxymuconate-semialdehyde decarboxylase
MKGDTPMSSTPPAIDCHMHWFPEAYYRFLASRGTEPTAELVNGIWSYRNGGRSIPDMSPEWFDLGTQFETAALTGRDMVIVSSLGVHGDLDGLPGAEAVEAARMINEEWAAAQVRHPGKFFAAAAVPLVDTDAAIAEMEYAVGHLGFCGVSLPSSVAGEPLDAPRLRPFFERLEQLGVPAFLHPIDSVLLDAMSGYDGALHDSLGRVCDSSLAVLRLILSGTFDRHPGLRILHFHAGGVLPYAAGRLDKNASITAIEEPPTAYLKRMWVDTAMPHALTVAMAVDFYGPDRVLYGSDNPCWNPVAALRATEGAGLDEEVMRAVLTENAAGLLALQPAPAGMAGQIND